MSLKTANLQEFLTINVQELLQNPENSHANMDAATHIVTKCKYIYITEEHVAESLAQLLTTTWSAGQLILMFLQVSMPTFIKSIYHIVCNKCPPSN